MPIPPPPPPPSISRQTTSPPKASAGRAQLLNEIHKGTCLKKTVTNDRSAPAISGKISREENSSNTAKNFAATAKAAPSKRDGAINFSDLFKDGIPRKPSDVKGQKSTSTTSIISRNENSITTKENNLQTNVAIKKFVPNSPNSSNSSESVGSSQSTRMMAMANLQKSISQSSTSTAVPPPLPAKLPKQKSEITPPGKPLSQQTQFQTLRPAKTQADVKQAKTALRRSGSNEELQKRPTAPPPPIVRRPGAPPPPPPSMAKPGRQIEQQQVQPKEPRTEKRAERTIDKFEPPPPLPPPRISSYLESMEQRFHFVPISELPPPPKFVGFRKDYGDADSHRRHEQVGNY